MPSGVLQEMTRAEFEAWKPEVAVLPVGATEQHGAHLPFGADTFQAERFATMAVKAANAEGGRILLLPTVPYGIDTNMMEFPYTATLLPSTLMIVIRDVIESMAHHGIRKFLMVNGHAGNSSTLETACREFFRKDMFIATINGWMLANDVARRVITTPPEHACEFETSSCLALLPEFVRMDLAKECPARPCKLPKLLMYGGKFSRPWEHFSESGGVGHPELATREKGDAMLEVALKRLKEILLELSNAEMTDTFPY